MVFILPAIPSLVYLLIVYVLPLPLPIRVEANLLDASWQVVLTDGFLRGAQFGRDIVYTYGPWGFLSNPRGDPAIYPWLVCGRLLITIAFVLGTSLIVSRGIRRPVYQFCFLAWVALLSDPIVVLPMVLFAVATLPDREKNRWTAAIIHLLAIACALTVWIKFTGFLIVGALAAALAVQDLMKRRWPALSLEIAAASMAFWLLAGQSLSGLPSFLHGALSTTLSYSAELFLPGPYGETAFITVLMVMIAVPATILFHYRRPWSLWPSLAWVGLLFFQQLKEAFVRYDPFHVWMGIINALLPCALILICRVGFFDPAPSYPSGVRMLIRVCAAWAVALSLLLAGIETGTRAGFERFRVLTQNIESLRELAVSRSLSDNYEAQLKKFSNEAPLSRVAGTADFFPDEQVVLYGNSLPVRMPPVPQSFDAANPYLSGLNASFFRGVSRPDFVFFDIAPIDGRYPSAADSLSWLAFMDCYRPSGSDGTYLVLRAAGCESASLDLVAETKTHAGKAITVPAGGGSALWVQMDIRLKRAGRIIAALSRSPSTRLEVSTGMGRMTFRISPEMARTGFLLSPLVLDSASFGRLFAPGGIDPRMEVRDLAIVQSELARRLYEPEIRVRFYKVDLRNRHPMVAVR